MHLNTRHSIERYRHRQVTGLATNRDLTGIFCERRTSPLYSDDIPPLRYRPQSKIASIIRVISRDDACAAHHLPGLHLSLAEYRPVLQTVGQQMARRPDSFRQQDVIKALRAVEAAGLNVSRIEIDRGGKIAVEAKRAEIPAGNSKKKREANEWDGD